MAIDAEPLIHNSDESLSSPLNRTDIPDPTFKRPILVLSIGFFAIFVAFNTTQSLASSLNKSLANACFASLYGVFALVCLVAPGLVGKTLGPKMAMLLGGVPYALMVFTYLKPMWGTSLPAHIMVGVGAPLLWTGSAVFISRYAKYSSIITNTPMSESTNRLNGVFFSVFHFTGLGLILASSIMSIWGSKANVPMFILLGAIAGGGIFIISITTSPPTPSELNQLQQRLKTQRYDPEPNSSNNTVNTDDTKGKNLTEEEDGGADEENQPQPSVFDVLALIAFQPKMTLMSFLILYNGLSMAFLFSDLSSGVIGKAIGTKVLGFVLSTYYLWNTVFTLLWTRILTMRNTPVILCLFVVAHTVFLAMLTFLPQSINFIPNPDPTSTEKQVKMFEPVVMDFIKGFLYCFFFSIGDSILQQQNQSLLQNFFVSNPSHSDQAMSAMKLVQSAGIAIMFVLGILTNDLTTKINVLWAFLGLATLALFYIIVRWVPMTHGVVPDGQKDQTD